MSVTAYTPPAITLTAEGAIDRGARLKLGTAALSCVEAGAAESSFAVALDSAASGELVKAVLVSSGFVYNLIATGAVVAGAALFATANGEVDDAGTGAERWTALEAAAAGDLFKCVPVWVGDIDAT